MFVLPVCGPAGLAPTARRLSAPRGSPRRAASPFLGFPAEAGNKVSALVALLGGTAPPAPAYGGASGGRGAPRPPPGRAQPSGRLALPICPNLRLSARPGPPPIAVQIVRGFSARSPLARALSALEISGAAAAPAHQSAQHPPQRPRPPPKSKQSRKQWHPAGPRLGAAGQSLMGQKWDMPALPANLGAAAQTHKGRRNKASPPVRGATGGLKCLYRGGCWRIRPPISYHGRPRLSRSTVCANV